MTNLSIKALSRTKNVFYWVELIASIGLVLCDVWIGLLVILYVTSIKIQRHTHQSLIIKEAEAEHEIHKSNNQSGERA